MKSIDKYHRRTYDKFIANDDNQGDNNTNNDNNNTKTIQQLYVRHEYFLLI